MRKFLSVIFLAVAAISGYAQFAINSGKPVSISIAGDAKPVVVSALAMVAGDCQNVFGSDLKQVKKNADIQVEIGAIPGNQAFRLEVTPKGKLVIASSDAHGAAYGLLELSRLFGVSPWEWWADAAPKALKHFELPVGYVNEQSPSVEYRGIFINDEDWGLMPWSSTTMEPENERGVIGPKTTEKIFQLMLRLRANYYWPPMHECSQPFFLTEGNREMAKKYGIYIGGSHCEPMASSTAGEWPRRGVGEYDYVNNSDNVLKFWEDRLKDVADQEILFTLGMRGVHDGAMNGAKTIEEQKAVLTRAIADQRALLAKYGKADAPQVFIPYKEVLDVYHAGLEVPDDVCLMWCDDNYGYIRHFPTEAEAARSGGNGVYYHVSYWGRPHDHLWLCTQSPYLLYQQMKEAYDRGIQRMWILNVGDIKPCEYQTELFMDMAWNMEAVAKSGVSKHLQAFLSREFGEEMGAKLTPVMEEHYRLAYIRRPEFMGGTRTEESDRKYWSTVRDLPWSREYIAQRMADYQALSHQTEALDNGTDAYFQLVKYPVQGAAQLNAKLLYAQLARHGEADWAKSDAAYDSIAALTKIYNQGISNQGKWRAMMDFQPRKQPVFDRVARAEASEPMVPEVKPLAMWNAMDCTAGNPVACPGLGYEGKAAAIAQGSELHFDFDGCQSDSVMVTLAMVPTHPISADGKLRIAVSINGSEPQVIDYHTEGRSEEWKLNVLSNQAIRSLALPIAKSKATLTLRALDEGIILDQVILNP